MASTPFVIVPSLAAVVVAYPQGKRIADNCFPRVNVNTQAFRYLKYALGDAFRTPDTLVGRKSAPNQLEWGSTEVSATVQDHGLDAPVPNADVLAHQMAQQAGSGNVSQVDPLARATSLVWEAVMNRREKRAADLMFNAANYGAANKQTLSGTGINFNHLTVSGSASKTTLPPLSRYSPSNLASGANSGVVGPTTMMAAASLGMACDSTRFKTAESKPSPARSSTLALMPPSLTLSNLGSPWPCMKYSFFFSWVVSWESALVKASSLSSLRRTSRP